MPSRSCEPPGKVSITRTRNRSKRFLRLMPRFVSVRIGPIVTGKNLILMRSNTLSQARKCARPRQCSSRQCRPLGSASGASIAAVFVLLRRTASSSSVSEYRTLHRVSPWSSITQKPDGRLGDPARSMPTYFKMVGVWQDGFGLTLYASSKNVGRTRCPRLFEQRDGRPSRIRAFV